MKHKNQHYPFSEEYEYETSLEKINLDSERKKSLLHSNGFVIKNNQSTLVENLKDPLSIYSTKFGFTLDDVENNMDKYKCDCGSLMSVVNEGTICKVCNTPVRYVDDNYNFFGWLVLNNPFYIIHPNIYRVILSFIGKKHLENIISIKLKKDVNGNIMGIEEHNSEPYYGIGILEFKERYLEILDYYMKVHKSKPKKKILYDDLIKYKDITFIQSIPVYTIHLRPYRLEGNKFTFEGTNDMYNSISIMVKNINSTSYKVIGRRKQKELLLYDLQCEYNKLYEEISNIIKGKSGTVRTLYGGRYNFSGRAVIVSNPDLRTDEVVLSIDVLTELLQQTIVNLLHKSGMDFAEAYNRFYKSKFKRDPLIVDLIKKYIKSYERGIPILINRNPTIAFGGIMQMFVVDVCDSHTMEIPLNITEPMGADFDGDALNILYIINRDFYLEANKIINPRNCMIISTNDGRLSRNMMHNKDTIINLNSFVGLGRNNYTQEQLDKIKYAKSL